MYLYQPCLLALALYAWAFDRGHGLRMLIPLLILAISGWELTFERIWLFPAAWLLPLMYLFHTAVWAEVLTASIAGGLVCWKMADTWPLLPGLTPLCALMLLILVVLLCRKREDRLLACAVSGMFFELFFCLREYMLFSFCTVRLGSREGLSLGSAALCLYCVLEQVFLAIQARKLTESKKSSCIFRSDVYN